MKKLSTAFALLTLSLPLAALMPSEEACASSTATSTTGEMNIIETALGAGNFGTLATALAAADLVGTLQGKGPFTVFAPTDEAFAKLPKGTIESLLKKENIATLSTILTYHVVGGKIPAADVVKQQSATALNGQTLEISVDDSGVTIAGAKIIVTDLHCTNGIIHVIDTVMMPATSTIIETALAAGNFTTLAAALGAADLVETLQGDGPFTVFAPTDEAFAALPKGTLESLLDPRNKRALSSILTHHVVSGRVPAAQVIERKHIVSLNGQRLGILADPQGVTIAGSKVIVTDIQCKNGTIHVIDTVMLPSSRNIVETAVEAGTFKTLVAAVGAGGLAEVLQGEGPFTVFAPTDDAFAALPEGTVPSLLLPENRDRLVALLKYHVVSGRVYSDQLAAGDVATLNGAKVKVSLRKAGAFLNESKVTAADIETTNGVIHVLDKVLLPN